MTTTPKQRARTRPWDGVGLAGRTSARGRRVLWRAVALSGSSAPESAERRDQPGAMYSSVFEGAFGPSSVNVPARLNGPSVAELEVAGVRRLSVGGALAYTAIGAAVDAARERLDNSTLRSWSLVQSGRGGVANGLRELLQAVTKRTQRLPDRRPRRSAR